MWCSSDCIIHGHGVAPGTELWVCQCRGVGLFLSQTMWDLWWTKWQWDWFLSFRTSVFACQHYSTMLQSVASCCMFIHFCLQNVSSRIVSICRPCKYGRVSFCDGPFYDDSLLRPLPRRTRHSQLMVHHCHNSSVLSVLSAFLALLVCACFIYVCYFLHT